MNKILVICTLLVFSVLSQPFNSSTVLGQEKKFEELAHKVIHTSANIKAGDVVVVWGGKHTIPLMEAFAIEAQKAGGMVEMFLYSDLVARDFYANAPEKYLEQEPTYFGEWLKQIDVWIGLPGVEDPKATFADIPQDRIAKAAGAYQIINEMVDEFAIRSLSIGYPTKQQAKNNQIAYSTLEKMHWEAVNADYEQISEKGNKLKKILKNAKEVKVTTLKGTDFTFSVGDRPIFVDDGIVTEEEAKGKNFIDRWANLPGGSVFVAPIETSANGRIVVPKDRCNYEPLTGVTFEFKNGKMHNFSAEKGEKCFRETLAPYTGPKDVFGYFSIGLNPAQKVIEDEGDYRPRIAAGMVTIGIGENQLLGGNNSTHQGGFNFPLVNATVDVDGKIVVKNGKLVF